jgi:hypothetical protein
MGRRREGGDSQMGLRRGKRAWQLSAAEEGKAALEEAHGESRRESDSIAP